ncbi:MAG: exonuclease [Candidatus Altiarchaeales archaeon]|nr:exonuclease [Candidatus Altiarchaeales archaeon]MBD3416423.1 exonuclease [Candidatus Altiarchaeales archaeon]
MIESTFQHIPGVGEKTERMLWERGVKSWRHLAKKEVELPAPICKRLRAACLESIARLDALDHHYFRERLPKPLTWRAYNAFRDHACYIDIETTGLSPVYDEVTTVCVHSGRETKSYVSGDNLGELKKDLQDFKYIVSFNGMRFDLPFLTHALDISFKQIHLDLMYPLRSLGFSGGLKRIESRLGMSRDTDGVTGYDAVRLWKAYENDRTVEVAGKKVKGEKALDLLVKYNRDDTVNLEKLAEYTVGQLKRKHSR